MVSKDNANTGSGGKTSCKKQQKCMVNSSQKAQQLYKDAQVIMFKPGLTSEVTSDNHSDPQRCSDGGRKTNLSEVTANSVIETATNEQTWNAWSAYNLENLKEMQYLQHDAEDSLIDASLDKSSLLGFIDSSNLESSEDVRTVPCIQVDVRTDVVLIDGDDDDMSLRERTVTDVSTTDGNAAELVCRRLQSISSNSSHSSCERQSEGRGSAMETPQETQETPKKHKRSCCLCVIT